MIFLKPCEALKPPKVLGNYTHYLIYAASSLAEQTYPLTLLIDDTDASVSSIHFHGQAFSSFQSVFFLGEGGWNECVPGSKLPLFPYNRG